MPEIVAFHEPHFCSFDSFTQVQATKAEVISTGQLPRAASTVLVDGNNVRGGGARRLSRSDLLHALQCLAATTATTITTTAAAAAAAATATATAVDDAEATRVRMVLYFDGGVDFGERSDATARGLGRGSGKGGEGSSGRPDNHVSGGGKGRGLGSPPPPSSSNSGAFEVVHCHREIADDIIVRDIESMLLSERRTETSMEGNKSPVTKAAATATTTTTGTGGVTDNATETKPSKAHPGQATNEAEGAVPVAAGSILVVTSDRGLMLRCLELGVLVLKCGPFLRLAQASQAAQAREL